MNTTGEIKNIALSFQSNRRVAVTLEVAATPEAVERYRGQVLDVTLNKHQEHRSLNANRFLWACIQDICNVTCEDKDTVYLDLLRHYGQHTLISVPAEAVDKLRKEWREVEVKGTYPVVDEYGNMTMRSDVLCYFGSHTYNASEFNRLLEGVKDMMRNADLTPPPDEKMRALIKEIEKQDELRDRGNR